MDARDPEGSWPRPGECPMEDAIFVTNKIDLVPSPSWDAAKLGRVHGGIAVSATLGTGIPELIAEIVKRIVGDPPPPGAPVPYTPQLIGLVEGALKALEGGQVDETRRLLGDCIASE
jgi:hypothetical protein